ncbi:hypothetical protein HPT25_07110 [Bacillus sp. BRMEA1]|uniref:hypothetical protein n=1 Tax=Neobacillus endophyticus TaxID=2738405 RepID=UPI0015673581|nr:hypothetical protein [Neobacillus endophyticus]NRD77265.1 hypothetical protein [Neobacillus endophyticus]
MMKWKVFLVSIVLLVAGVGGTLYYLLNVKQYNTADPKVEKIVKSGVKIKLPDSNIKKEPNQTGNKVTPIMASTNTEPALKKGKSAVLNKDSTASHAFQKITDAAIITKYQPSFLDLENEANSKLDSLLVSAAAEYKEKKAKGEDISYFYFYAKYGHAARMVETNIDASFNTIFNALVHDLEKSGYSAGEAQPIKDHYLEVKKQTSQTILAKALAYLN